MTTWIRRLIGRPAREVANATWIRSEHKRLGEALLILNQRLVASLPSDALQEGAKRLGLYRRGAIVLRSQDEMAVICEYCIHNVRRKGCNAIERYLCDSPPDPDSDEMTLLKAMQQAIYSIFVVQKRVRNVGVIARDVVADREHLIADVGLGRTAFPNVALATRLLPMEQFAMTGGATLLVGILPKEMADEWIGHFENAAIRPGSDPAWIIRTCLQSESSRLGQFRVLGTASATFPSPLATSPRKNDSCPCGSGRRYKNCCMRRQ